jgi:hypothetical protein
VSKLAISTAGSSVVVVKVLDCDLLECGCGCG